MSSETHLIARGRCTILGFLVIALLALVGALASSSAAAGASFSANAPGAPAEPSGLRGRLEIHTTVTCLAGNGRVDVNIVNRDAEPVAVGLELGSLSRRVRTLSAGTWWRMPYTGRPDGPLDLTITADDAVVYVEGLVVSCDEDVPVIDEPELQTVAGCRNGLGYVLFQFANATDVAKGYVIEFEGVPNRSTGAAAFGQAIRAVTGRFDGVYDYRVTSADGTSTAGSVAVRCEHADTALDADLDPNSANVAPELQRQLNQLAEQGGGTLWIPPHPQGDAWPTSSVRVASNIAIRGEQGARVTAPFGGREIFWLDQVDNVTISDLAIDAGLTTYGIVSELSSNLEVTNNEILDTRHGAVTLFRSVDSVISRNRIANSGNQGSGAGIWLFASSDNDVSNNDITSDQGGAGVVIDDRSSAEPCREPDEEGCDVNTGIASENDVHHNRIEMRTAGNVQAANATGVVVETGFRNVIRNNYIVAHWIGVQVQTGTSGEVVDGLWGPTDETRVVDNIICGERIGLIGAQTEKGAVSTTIIDGRIDGFKWGLRFLPTIAPGGTNVMGGAMIISNTEVAPVVPAEFIVGAPDIVAGESDPGPCPSGPPG